MNQVCECLRIRYPIIQGAMTDVAEPTLVCAVSKAGGLGVYTPGVKDIDMEKVRREIRFVREQTGNRFAVNIMLASAYAREIVELICEERVPVVTTGAGNPARYMERLKGAGVLVAPVVSTVEQAVKMEAVGADLIIASGMEGGGYIGRISTMALIPQVVRSVRIPVIAAGGIADGRGMAAAMALGAQGVQMGTRLIATRECCVPDWYKEMLVNAKAEDAMVLGDGAGASARLRVMRTPFTEWIRVLEHEDGMTDERFRQLLAGVRTNFSAGPDGLLVGVGQSVGLIHEIPSVETLIMGLMEEYQRIFAEHNGG